MSVSRDGIRYTITVYALLLRDKVNIPTITIRGCTWDNGNVNAAAYMNRFVAKLQ